MKETLPKVSDDIHEEINIIKEMVENLQSKFRVIICYYLHEKINIIK